MSYLNLALIGICAVGIFFVWFGGVNIARSKRQLRKGVNYSIVRDRLERQLQLFAEKERTSFLKRRLKTWNMWSEIGKREPLSLSSLLIRSIMMSLLFAAFSHFLTSSTLLVILGGIFGLTLPLLALKAKYAHVTHRARRFGLLPYVDVYKNAYISANFNVITAFHVSEQDCPRDMRPVLEWLLRRLHDGSSQKEGLREFASILHSEWAQVFVNYCISGLEGEAENITRSLSQVQIEMHGMRDEEEEKEVITKAAFYANFIIIGLTLVGVFFISMLLPIIKRFFVEDEVGHVLLNIALYTWGATILYSYFRLKGGDN